MPHFVGSRVKIPCDGFKWNPEFRNTYLYWSICTNCKVQGDLITSTTFITAEHWETDYPNDSFKGRLDISVPSGDLIILETQKRDEGLYTCEFIGGVPNQHQLLLHGKFLHTL